MANSEGQGGKRYRFAGVIRRYFAEETAVAGDLDEAHRKLPGNRALDVDLVARRTAIGGEARIVRFMRQAFAGEGMERRMRMLDKERGLLNNATEQVWQVVSGKIMQRRHASEMIGYHEAMRDKLQRRLRRMPNRHDNKYLTEPRVWGEQPRADLLGTLQGLVGAWRPLMEAAG